MTCRNHRGDQSVDGIAGIVLSIQRYSIQDGPGIRTTVFLKGCPLRCRWCSNPESQSPDPELMFRSQNCQSCGTCEETCTIGAVRFEDGRPHLDRDMCTLCMDCVTACTGGALEISGKHMVLEDVVEEACKDELFYTNSGGGVTLSGGEPLSQPEFAYRFLQKCKERSISTALDTSGHAPWGTLSRVLEHTDLVLFDLKHLNPEKHLEGTHLTNDLILENLKKTVSLMDVRVWIRIPVIPGYNDSEAFFRELASVIKELPVEKVSLLGGHEWGRAKYDALDREYPLGQVGALPKEELEPLKQILEAEGINVTVDH